MSTRTRKLVELVTSKDEHGLDLPKYESTKGTSKEDQAMDLNILQIQTRKHFEEEKEKEIAN